MLVGIRTEDPGQLKAMQEAAQQRSEEAKARAEAQKQDRGEMIQTGSTILGTILGSLFGNPIGGMKLGQAAGGIGKAAMTKDLAGAASSVASLGSSLSGMGGEVPGAGQHVTHGDSLSNLSMDELIAKKKHLEGLLSGG